MRWSYAWFPILLILLVEGCGTSEPTGIQESDSAPETHDAQVVSIWMPGRETTDAIAFLEGGGVYESLLTDVDIDKLNLLPLLRRLRDDFGLAPVALLDDPEVAFAVIVDIRQLEGPKGDVVDAIEEADDDFSGLILDKWGEQWLTIDMMDETELQPLVQGGALENLQEMLAIERNAIRSGG